MTNNQEEIHRGVWKETLEALTAEHQGDVATVEVTGVDVGDQFAAEQVPFSYVEYDPHDDAVSVGVNGLDSSDPVVLRHVVEHPQNVVVHASDVDSVTIEVGSPDGTVTLITLTSRPELADG
jgi:hypothetical protein